MKVLQINCVYKKGSTGKITYELHKGLIDAGIESIVCYGRGERVDEPDVYKVCPEWYSKLNNAWSRINGIMYGGCFFSTNKLISIIKRENPDIVHLQCINGYFVNIYRLITWLKRHHVKTVLTLHAEFMYTANCGYALDCERWKIGCGECPRRKEETKSFLIDGTSSSWEKMKKAFDGYTDMTIVGVSNWISNRAYEAPIMDNCKISTIYNGIETDKIFCPRDNQIAKRKYNLSLHKKIVLSVVPSFDSSLKGGKLMMQLATSMDAAKYQFVIVGAKNEVVAKPDNMIIIPYTQNQDELAELYSAADVFVMGSIVDNYPTVCVEANSCGTPIVGMNVGGVAETIFPQMGVVVPYGEFEELKAKIEEWSDKKRFISEETLTLSRKKNSKARMIQEYIDLYNQIL